MKNTCKDLMIVGLCLLLLCYLDAVGSVLNIRPFQFIHNLLSAVQSSTRRLSDRPSQIILVYISAWSLVLLGWTGFHAERIREKVDSR